MGNGRLTARRIIAQNELGDSEALDLIAGLLSNSRWGADTVHQIASFLGETGREVPRPLDDPDDLDDEGYDPDEGEFMDYEEDPDEAALLVSSAVGRIGKSAALTDEFSQAYREWQEDCLREWNAKMGEDRTHFEDDGSVTDPGQLVEFSENGDAYPHGAGGTNWVRGAVTPWADSPHHTD